VPRRSIVADPRIEQPIGKIDENIHHHKDRGEEEHASLHQEEIAFLDGVHQKPADPGTGREARARNRRVEVKIYSADEALAPVSTIGSN